MVGVAGGVHGMVMVAVSTGGAGAMLVSFHLGCARVLLRTIGHWWTRWCWLGWSRDMAAGWGGQG